MINLKENIVSAIPLAMLSVYAYSGIDWLGTAVYTLYSLMIVFVLLIGLFLVAKGPLVVDGKGDGFSIYVLPTLTCLVFGYAGWNAMLVCYFLTVVVLSVIVSNKVIYKG